MYFIGDYYQLGNDTAKLTVSDSSLIKKCRNVYYVPAYLLKIVMFYLYNHHNLLSNFFREKSGFL